MYLKHVNIIGTGDLWSRMSLLLSLFHCGLAVSGGTRECWLKSHHHTNTMTKTQSHIHSEAKTKSVIYVIAVQSFMNHTN